MKQWLTSPGSSCIECSRLFPFSCSTFSKTSFCYEQALGQRHQSQCQCIRVQHTVIPARMPSMESNTRISLFVTELYLRNRVSDHHVSSSSRPTGLWLSHGESMIQLPSLLLILNLLHAEKGRLRNAVANRVPASRWQGILFRINCEIISC